MKGQPLLLWRHLSRPDNNPDWGANRRADPSVLTTRRPQARALSVGAVFTTAASAERGPWWRPYRPNDGCLCRPVAQLLPHQ